MTKLGKNLMPTTLRSLPHLLLFSLTLHSLYPPLPCAPNAHTTTACDGCVVVGSVIAGVVTEVRLSGDAGGPHEGHLVWWTPRGEEGEAACPAAPADGGVQVL